MTGAAVPSVVRRAETAGCCADPDDADWGRLPGAAPPLAWWLPLAVFGVVAAALAVVVVLVVRGPGPRDDPDPAFQRDGLLQDGPVLPEQVAGVRFGDRPVVVLFERQAPAGPHVEPWRAEVTDEGVDLVVAVAGSDRSRQLAAAVGMPTPVDGGPPVGYAVVDPARQVRYATLDPAYLDNTFEVEVITDAVAERDR